MNLQEISDVQSDKSADVVIVNRNNLRTKTFVGIRKVSANIREEELYTDDQFKIVTDRQSKKTIKRLKDIYQVNTSLFIDIKTGKNRDKFTKKQFNVSKPSYLSEINMLPFFHYQKLIQPAYINPSGYYHVAMWKDGAVYKEIIDDEFYFDEKLNEIQCHPLLKNHPWINILIKAWAKKNKSYEKLYDCEPFEFIKTFSYPDWEVINPNVEKLQYLIGRFTRVSSKKQYMIAKTKNDSKVGLFGFTPNCSSYIIDGHYQQYGGLFIKIRPLVHDRWNGELCDDESQMPDEMPRLLPNEILLPSKQFLNIFHLLYTTNNKFYVHSQGSEANEAQNYQIFYSKFTLAIDARESKAKVLTFQVTEKQRQIGLNLYFPKISIFDLMNNIHGFHEPHDMIVPWCKILIGLQLDNNNVDASYVESVKEKLFLGNNDDEIGFIASNTQYQYVLSDYFQGYCSEVSYNLSLKPGKYFIRLKSEQKKSEYRCYINTVAIGAQIKISDSKMQKTEQVQLLKQILSSKARNQKKNITYLNKIKKGSWISCNNDFDKLGYCTIVAKSIQHADNKILISIDPKVLAEHGYLVKDHKDQKPYSIQLDRDQSTIIILKHDKTWKQVYERFWPPQGIQFFKIPLK